MGIVYHKWRGTQRDRPAGTFHIGTTCPLCYARLSKLGTLAPDASAGECRCLRFAPRVRRRHCPLRRRRRSRLPPLPAWQVDDLCVRIDAPAGRGQPVAISAPDATHREAARSSTVRHATVRVQGGCMGRGLLAALLCLILARSVHSGCTIRAEKWRFALSQKTCIITRVRQIHLSDTGKSVQVRCCGATVTSLRKPECRCCASCAPQDMARRPTNVGRCGCFFSFSYLIQRHKRRDARWT